MGKNLIYQVYVGAHSRLYDWCTESVEEYASMIGAEYIRQTKPKLFIRPDPFRSNRSRDAVERLGYLPIFEKENAFDLLDQYDKIAIIDSDIYIRHGAPSIFDELEGGMNFAGVVEREMPVTPEYGRKILNYSQMQYGQISNVDFKWNDQLGRPHPYGGEFFNMGMMLLDRTFAHHLNNMDAKAWIHQPMFKDMVDGRGNWKWSTDQTMLNTFIKYKKMKVQHLSYRWNALYSAIPMDKIYGANFIHFFLKDKLPERGENIEELAKACRIEI